MVNFVNRMKISPNYKWWAASVMAIGTLVTVADTGELNIAMPIIAYQFNSDLSTVQWLVTGYMVAQSAFLMPMGRLSDMVGRKKVYLWGLLVFTVGSGLASLSSGLAVLILFRVVQGLGLGMVHGNQMAIMTSVFPAEERGKALGIHMTLVGTALIIGPALGGFLVDLYGWRSIFVLNVPLGAACILPGLLILDEAKIMQARVDSSRGGFDWIGAILSSAVLLTFLMGMINPWGWYWGFTAGLLMVCVVLMGAFVIWELKNPMPMLDMHLFRAPIFSLGVAARSMAFMASATVLFLMPFYLQGVAGYSAKQAGLIMVTVAIGMVTVGPLSGRLSDRFGWRLFNVAGAAVSVAGLFMLAHITESTPLVIIIAGIVLQSCGMGLFSAPNSSSILSAVDRTRYGVISGFVQLLRTGSTVTGVAIATVIITATMSDLGFETNLKVLAEGASPAIGQAFSSGLRTVYMFMAGIQLVAVVLSLVKAREPKESFVAVR